MDLHNMRLMLLLFLSGMANAYIQPYWQIYGPSKILGNNDLYPGISQKLILKSSPKILLVVNPRFSDISALNKKMKEIKHEVKLVSKHIDEDRTYQYIGIEAAKSRNESKLVAANSDFAVTVISFLTEPEIDPPRSYELVTFMQGNKFIHMVSKGIEILPNIYDEAVEMFGVSDDHTKIFGNIGQALEANFGNNQLNWQQFVTGSKMSAEQQVRSALLLANKSLE